MQMIVALPQPVMIQTDLMATATNRLCAMLTTILHCIRPRKFSALSR